MHFTIPIYGYNDTFVNGFDTKALDWDVLYNAVNIYFDADYFDYIDKVEVISSSFLVVKLSLAKNVMRLWSESCVRRWM